MPFVLLLVILALLQGCIAPAVSDVNGNYASPFPDTTSLIAPSDPIANTCKDLDHCRSLVSIVTSCLATIFACVWVAVHPNVPGPKQSWISRQMESVKVVVVTLLVPEWVLAWAVRQCLRAREYRYELNSASEQAVRAIQDNENNTHEGNTSRASSSDQERDQAHGIWLEAVSTAHDNSSRGSTGNVREARIGELDNERASPVLHQYREMGTQVPPERGVLWQLESDLGRTDQRWTMTHGFLMTMGGFHSYRGGEAASPLDYGAVLELVRSRSLLPPTSDELRDRSKGDALSKTIAILQTLWFVAQCIARRVENLAITNLEIMTLAYTVITVAMEMKNIIQYVTGDQDLLIDLRGEERVPTFWSSSNSYFSQLPLYADMIALSVATVFGAVHCAAWSYAFPSLEQKWMWRVCALAIAAIPLPMAVAFAVFDPFLASYGASGLSDYAQLICMALGALLYIPARMILLVLSFTTLRQLPLSAYQTVQWTTWIPHV